MLSLTIGASALLPTRCQSVTLKVYKGGPHGMCTTQEDEISEDIKESTVGSGELLQPEIGLPAV